MKKRKKIKPNNYVDLTIVGKKFSELTVISFSHTVDYKSYWNCQCTCGNYKIVSRSHLTSGNVSSCGCQTNEKRAAAHRLEFGESAFNQVYNDYIQSAKLKKLPFKLSKKIFKEKSQENCAYCGKPPSNTEKSGRYFGSFMYNGFDRVDNTKGYIINNIVPCCKWCNQMKLAYSKEDFLNHIKRIYNHSISKFTA